MEDTMGLFVSLKKQAEIMFRLICCERKILFQLKKTDYKINEYDLIVVYLNIFAG